MNMTPKQKLLDAVESLRRKVETGEVIGLVIGATTPNDYFLSMTVGKAPGPHGILIFEDLVAQAKRTILEQNVPQASGPSLGVAPMEGAEPNSQETDET
jgi:hypothetical protein